MKRACLILILFLIAKISLCQANAYMGAGGYHSLFICRDKSVMSCGANDYGELGNGSFSPLPNPIPGQVNLLNGIISVAGGGVYYSLFLKNDSTVWSCGYNSFGQLGDGTTIDRNIPVLVSGLNGIISISAGMTHSLFLKRDSTVWVCGGGTSGELGTGTSFQPIPVMINSLSKITRIASRGYNSFFLRSDSTVWACGQNSFGQLGDGTTVSKPTPFQINSLSGIIKIAGGEYHTLFLRKDGTVWACGYNGNGQLGDGTTIDKNIPVQVNGLNGIVDISAGYYHSLFLKNDSTVWSVGANALKQLGDGMNVDKSIPIQASGLSGIIAIAAGGYHSLFYRKDSVFLGCGQAGWGQIGTGTFTIPRIITGLCCSPVPQMSITSSSSMICNSGSAILGTNGASTYTWSTGSNSSSILISPTVTSNYSVAGTTSKGCNLTAAFTQSVDNSVLNMTSTASVICSTESSMLSVNGANTYTWSTGSNASSIIVSPTITTNYIVNGTTSNGCTLSSVITQSVDACIGIEEYNKNISLKIYPNPTTGKVEVVLSSSAIDVKITLVNSLCQIILEERKTNSNKFTLDASNFTNGIYFVEVESDRGISRAKFVKN